MKNVIGVQLKKDETVLKISEDVGTKRYNANIKKKITRFEKDV